jgi:serine/threonine protein kinase
MSANRQDALPGFPRPLLRIDAPASGIAVPDLTDELANEITSELDPGLRRAAPQPPPVSANAASHPHGLAAGATVLRERYVLEMLLGGGGTALVYRAVDLRRDGSAAEGRRVAIKLLRPELRDRPRSIARLQREFRQTQALSHPNVVRVFDLDCDRGAWFIVMELLSGEPLGALLRRLHPAALPAEQALRIALAVGDALAQAHAQGIAHGDVKPDNIFLTDSGDVRLLDFGVAPESSRALEGGAAALLLAGAAATRVYASPEVLASLEPEPRDDVFSLACVAHEMLAGAHPYGRRGADVAAREGVVPEPPPAVDGVRRAALAAGLSLARVGRPSMGEFVKALRTEPCAEPPAGRIEPVVAIAEAPVAAQAVAASEERPAKRPGITLLAAVAAGLALVLGILIGRFDTQNAPAPQPHAPPAQARAATVPEPPPAESAPAVDALMPAESAVPPVLTEATVPPSGPPGIVFFDAQAMTVSKSATVAAIPLRHLSHARRAVRVNWQLSDGTARAGRDYGGPQAGVETFVEGNTFRILYVPLTPDPRATRDRTFAVELTGASDGFELGPVPRVLVTIEGGP